MQTKMEFLNEYSRRLGVSPLYLSNDEYSQYCYDATWSLIKAINRTIEGRCVLSIFIIQMLWSLLHKMKKTWWFWVLSYCWGLPLSIPLIGAFSLLRLPIVTLGPNSHFKVAWCLPTRLSQHCPSPTNHVSQTSGLGEYSPLTCMDCYWHWT
jgi:hypothetical protein